METLCWTLLIFIIIIIIIYAKSWKIFKLTLEYADIVNELDGDGRRTCYYLVKYIKGITHLKPEIIVTQIIMPSPFLKLLKENPEEVNHEGIDYWGDTLIEQYERRIADECS